MSLYEDINKACEGHRAWKARLARAIHDGKADITPQKAEMDDCCDFGRWLYALPLAMQRSSYWQTVHDLHAQFHKQAALVLRLALAGHRQLAELAMSPGSGFDLVSTDLSAALKHWRKGHRHGDYPRDFSDEAHSI